MIIPREIAAKYRDLEPYLMQLREQVRGTLQPFCDKNKFALVARIKEPASLSEKIESGRYSAWSELDDLVALSIVIPTLAEEAAVLEFLRATFKEGATRLRGTTKKNPAVFRFDVTRFVGKQKSPLQLEPGQRVYYETPFEIQIRSAFEHAWIVTTHAITFKANNVDWKRLRLAAQLKAAVEQLDMLILGFEDASLKLEESRWPEIEAKKAIVDFLKMQATDGLVPNEVVPKDFNRFGDNIYSLLRASEQFANEEPSRIAETITFALGREIKALGLDHIPRSLSMLQFAFGALCKGEILKPPLNRYVPLITPELELFYPATKAFSVRFNFAG
jgi:ppGpp synthetase/RelA/SpoT-type nucleotidyltranferase